MSIMATLAAGGQTWVHRMRMLRQVFKIASLLSFVCCGLFFLFEFHATPWEDYQCVYYNAKANISESLGYREVSVDLKFWETVSREKRNNSQISIAKLKKVTYPRVRPFLRSVYSSFLNASRFISISFFSIIAYFLLRGRFWERSQHISGRKLSNKLLLKWRLKLSRKASKIEIGGVPLVKGTETRHILVTGGTGSGKTNCLFYMLDQIRKLGQKAIIVDTTGLFVEKYYRPNIDKILSPFDPMSQQWHPWIECEEEVDYDFIAESFIPHSFSEQENYWRMAAKTLFSSLIQKTKITKKTSDLSRWALYEPLKNLCEFVEGTKAASHLDIHAEKTAASIRSVLSSFLGSLDYIRDAERPFSVKNWVHENNSEWLFLSCPPSKREIGRPLISCWLSIAIRALFDLPQDLNRRLWFVIDELPGMKRIVDLEMLLAESRKYGGCALLSLQSPSQLETIYGKSSTQTIIGNCSTKIVFSEKTPLIAEEISQSFGTKVCREFNEGISYGANDVRDGVNISSLKKDNRCISSSKIMSLRVNQAFLNLPENLPLTKIKLNIYK